VQHFVTQNVKFFYAQKARKAAAPASMPQKKYREPLSVMRDDSKISGKKASMSNAIQTKKMTVSTFSAIAFATANLAALSAGAETIAPDATARC